MSVGEDIFLSCIPENVPIVVDPDLKQEMERTETLMSEWDLYMMEVSKRYFFRIPTFGVKEGVAECLPKP
jgi:hypothetical protein